MGSHADELRVRLLEAFRWADVGTNQVSDLSGWWRDRSLLAEMGPTLAELFPGVTPTVILGPEASGFLVGPLVAWELGAGFVEAYRDGDRMIADETLARTAPVDDRGRSVTLHVRTRHLGPDDQVLVVDDWAESGAQLAALRDIVREAGATYLGAAVIVNGCDPGTREELTVRGLLERAELG
ncbi:MAG TPA: phosphoribosyltransferase family protein [Micromonosporaceae bacterium]|nr:phosphoribosyltransferase family protein [Micromonosporaceae bacterium]